MREIRSRVDLAIKGCSCKGGRTTNNCGSRKKGYLVVWAVVNGTGYGLSAKGWIEQSLFDSWFTDHFLKYTPVVNPFLLLLS